MTNSIPNPNTPTGPSTPNTSTTTTTTNTGTTAPPPPTTMPTNTTTPQPQTPVTNPTQGAHTQNGATINTRSATRQNQQNTTATTGPTPQPPPPPQYTPIFPSAVTLPIPTGDISTILATPSQQDQISRSETFLALLQSQSPDFRTLNEPTSVYTALLLIPGTSTVKLVYNVSFGTPDPANTTPLTNKILALTNDGNTLIGHPDVIVLDPQIVDTTRSCACPSEQVTKAELQTLQVATVPHFLFPPRNINTQESIFACAPCPFFLVPDGMHQDIPAMEILERAWMHLPQNSPMTKHLQHFLQAASTGPLRQTDEKPHAHISEWHRRIPVEAKIWTKQQCHTLFPTVFQATPPQVQPPQNTTPPTPALVPTLTTTAPTPTTAAPTTTQTNHPVLPQLNAFPPGLPPLPQGQLSESFVLEMMKLMHANMTKPAQITEEKKEENSAISTKISDREARLMKTLCGQDPESDNMVLPAWFHKLFQKNITDTDKDHIVGEILNAGTPRFQCEKLRGYPELKKMIRKRDWAGGESGCEPSYAYACYGLTIFAMLDLTEDEAAQMRFDDEMRNAATAVSPDELKKVTKKLLPTIPDCGLKWRGMIFKLTNLLRNIFTAECRLYVKLVHLCKILLDTYSEETIRNLSLQAKAAFSWILHRQCRHFAQGKMDPKDPNRELLPEFQMLYNQVCAGHIHLVSFASLPARLITPSQSSAGKRKLDDLGITAGGITEQLAKLQKLEKALTDKLKDKGGKNGGDYDKTRTRDPWNPILEGKLLPALKQANFLSLGRICKFVNIEQDRVLPNLEKGTCRNFAILGRCRWGPKRCKMDHKTISTEQATEVIEKFEQFIAAPDSLPSGPVNILLDPLTFESTPDPPLVKPQVPSTIPPSNPKKRTTTEIQRSVLPTSIHTQTPEEQDQAISDAVQKLDAVPQVIRDRLGKTMYPRGPAMKHEAAPLLNYWAEHGCPVDCGEDWSDEWIEAAIRRGPHISAKKPLAVQALRKETMDKINSGYARKIKWGVLRKHRPKKLKISPVAAIPHKSRLFRTILDLSFRLKYKGKKLPSVNSASKLLAPAEAMTQLGHCINRIIHTLATNYDPKNPFLFAKLDIKDGFWRMAVSDDDAWNFCYVMPTEDPLTNLDDADIVVPNSLQMGWAESPPYFCAATETARDVVDQLLQEVNLPEHPLENQMLAKADSLQRLQAAATTTNLVEVFVDDFCALTNNNTKEHLEHFSRALLLGVHSIFPPPAVSGHTGEEPVSQKKMEEGEGVWDSTKEMLGWIVDGINFTLTLPEKKCEKIIQDIRHIVQKRGVDLNTFQKITGKLQHASFGIPGGRGLMSPLHMAMAKNPKWVKMTGTLKQTLKDWTALVRDLTKNPTLVTLLIRQTPEILQYTDACGLGAGGVVCAGTRSIQPLVWQYQWPQDIIDRLVTAENPDGDLTINDLELAGMILGWLVIEKSQKDLEQTHIGTFCDNTSAVSWAYKGHTSRSIPAARLLRFLCLRQRTRRVSSLTPIHISGIHNIMADICSRAFKSGKYFEAHKQILEGVDPARKVDIARDFLLAWRASSTGITRSTARNHDKYWRHWKTYTAEFGQNPYLDNTDELTAAIITMGFAARVRSGAYGNGAEIKVQSVTEALASVSKTIQLVGKPCPFHKDKTTYIVPVGRCIEGFRRQDPPPVPQLALPVDVPEYMHKKAYSLPSISEFFKAIADLALIAFFFLLRSGEYTKPKMTTVNGEAVRATRTETFRVCDIGFWKDSKVLSRHSPLEVLLTADSATMKITHQKNGRMGEVVHQETTGETGAVAALARRVNHILDHNGPENSPICNVCIKEKWHSITQPEMLRQVRQAVRELRLDKQGIDPDIIGNHSLRSGGAMALKLNNYSDSDIMKFGRWKSATWMMYMHNQIAHLTQGVASAMCKKVPFLNIGYIEAPQHVQA